MKRYAFFGLAMIMACGGLVAYVMAQQAAPTNPKSILPKAYALISSGQPDAARELLATITEADPDFTASKHYEALTLAAKDRLTFLKAMEKLPTTLVALPPEVEIELTAHHIEALSFYRKFEELLPKAMTFLEQHAEAPDAAEVREHLLVGLFERGLKKIFEAGRLTDETKFKERWTEGRANLEQFLTLAAAFPATNYTVLPDRKLRDDLCKARIILGDEAAALKELAGQDVVEREKLSLLRVLLYPKIQPNQAALNLQRMTDFLKEYPQSRHRMKVEFEMANVALLEGERLANEARSNPDAKAAAVPRAAATPYLELAQGLFPRIAEDQEAGIGATELHEARIRMMRVFFAQEDWVNLSERARQLLAADPDEKERLVILLYHGYGLTLEGKFPAAAQVLDETLAIGFRGTPSYDGLLVSAAGWRFRVARQSGDEAAARRVVELVRNSNCYGSRKRTFLEKFEPMLKQAAPVVK